MNPIKAVSINFDNEPLLTIHCDGRVTTSDRLKPTETAALALIQIKTQWMKDAQATKIRELQDQIERLEDWKQSALAVEREWNANAIATMLGGKLGESQREVIQREVPKLLAYIKRLEEAERWIPANTKPEGFERRVLLWIVWPQMHGWCDSPEPLIGWWKHGPKCFALGDIENADHLVRYWMEIPDPTETKEAKP